MCITIYVFLEEEEEPDNDRSLEKGNATLDSNKVGPDQGFGAGAGVIGWSRSGYFGPAPISAPA